MLAESARSTSTRNCRSDVMPRCRDALPMLGARHGRCPDEPDRQSVRGEPDKTRGSVDGVQVTYDAERYNSALLRVANRLCSDGARR